MENSIFENTFQKYAGIITEGAKVHRRLTKEQNSALKKVYIVLRDCLKNVLRDAREMDVTTDNYGHKFEDFMREYQSSNPYIEVLDRETIKVCLPDDVKKTFKCLENSLTLKIVAKTKSILKTGSIISKAGVERGRTNKVKAIYVRTDMLFKNFNDVKVALQHEIQHIAHQAGVDGIDGDEAEVVKLKKYYSDSGEISAHCKSFAYMYLKKYPDDAELDFGKFTRTFCNKKHKSIDTYMGFGKGDETERRVYENFVDTLKVSLTYFKQF